MGSPVGPSVEPMQPLVVLLKLEGRVSLGVPHTSSVPQEHRRRAHRCQRCPSLFQYPSSILSDTVPAVKGEVFQHHGQTRKGGWGDERQEINTWHSSCQPHKPVIFLLTLRYYVPNLAGYFHHTYKYICPFDCLPHLSGYALPLSQLSELAHRDATHCHTRGSTPRQLCSFCLLNVLICLLFH